MCNISMHPSLPDAVMTNLMLSLLLLYSQHVESVAPSSAKSSSSCKPLGSFVSCYEVVHVPAFTDIFSYAYRGVEPELPVNMTALGRKFSLRLYFDPITGDAGGLRPELAWSSVLSPSSSVHVMGESGHVNKYSESDLNISWYIGLDKYEVAPSSVLASVIDFNGQQLFRAVIHTTSDVYYVEPALHYPQVERT